MEGLNEYQRAKTLYNAWSQERQRVINELSKLRDGIQELDRNYAVGSTVYSSLGLLSGGIAVAGLLLAPWFFVPAEIAASAAAGTAAVSGALDVGHGVINYVKIKGLCEVAQKLLEHHDRSCISLMEALTLLHKAVEVWVAKENVSSAIKHGKAAMVFAETGDLTRANKCIKLSSFMESVLPSSATEVSGGVKILSKGALRTLAAVGIVASVASIIMSVKDMNNLEKGHLSTEAQKIQDIINHLKMEMKKIDAIFE